MGGELGCDVHVLQDAHFLLKEAHLMLGLDHISNNIQNDMDDHLQHFSSKWLGQFKVLRNLLGSHDLLQRLQATCIIGTQYDNPGFRAVFSTRVRNIAKWRWGTICLALPEVLAKLPVLKLVWKADKFLSKKTREQGSAENDTAISSKDIEEVTAILQSELFLSYSQMLLQLHLFANYISTWASGCHCHGWLHECEDKVLACTNSEHSENLVVQLSAVQTLTDMHDGLSQPIQL